MQSELVMACEFRNSPHCTAYLPGVLLPLVVCIPCTILLRCHLGVDIRIGPHLIPMYKEQIQIIL